MSLIKWEAAVISAFIIIAWKKRNSVSDFSKMPVGGIFSVGGNVVKEQRHNQ